MVQPEACQREAGLKSSTDPLGDFANDLTSYKYIKVKDVPGITSLLTAFLERERGGQHGR